MSACLSEKGFNFAAQLGAVSTGRLSVLGFHRQPANFKMKHGFQNKKLDIETYDGLDDVLLEPLLFIRKNGTMLRAPIGGTTDGMSTPKVVRILPGYDATGDDWLSGCLHDSAYRDQLEQYYPVARVWDAAHYNQKESDDLMFEAMQSQGVGFPRSHIIYYALRWFGSFAFSKDRGNNLGAGGATEKADSSAGRRATPSA